MEESKGRIPFYYGKQKVYEWEQTLEEIIVYIQAPDCGLCSVMLGKVEQATQRFSELCAARVELHVVPQVTGEFLVATAPTVLLFVNGKEVYRAGTFINVRELECEIEKWNKVIN